MRKSPSKRQAVNGVFPVENVWPFDTDVGEPILPRLQAFDGNQSLGLGNVALTYFRARRTQTITQIRNIITAIGTGNTLQRMGVYSVGAGGALSALLASTVNDTTIFQTTGVRDKALSSNFSEVEGTVYALARIVVGGTVHPKFTGYYMGSAFESALSPPIFGVIYGQTDLPASAAIGGGANQVTFVNFGYQGYLLP